MIFVFLRLTSLGMLISRPIHTAADSIISFFFMTEYYCIVYVYNLFFIRSSSSGRLGCSHVLATVNSIAINTEVRVSFCTVSFSGYTPKSGVYVPRVGLLDHVIALFLAF